MRAKQLPEPALLLLALVTIDVVFVVLHLVYMYTPILDDPRFSIELDRGFSEIYQYGKELCAVIILAMLFARRKSPLLLGWTFLFVYLLADDSFQIHENGGVWIATVMGLIPQFRLRAEDFGELAIAGLVFGVFAISMGNAWTRSERPDRRTSLILFGLVFGLVGFGIGVDMLHIALWGTLLRPFLGMVEDGGEMLMMSFIVWFLYRQITKIEPEVRVVPSKL